MAYGSPTFRMALEHGYYARVNGPQRTKPIYLKTGLFKSFTFGLKCEQKLAVVLIQVASTIKHSVILSLNFEVITNKCLSHSDQLSHFK